MINYHRSAFGLNLLFRLHGSATYRAFLPALFAVFFFLFLRLYINDRHQPTEVTLEHPYVVGVVVGGITFLIVFRASSSYARYWEAASSVYQMQSKWMDATVHTGCYHLQCHHYDHIKPPSFFDYPKLNSQFLTRDRERVSLSASDRGHLGVMNSKRALERSINAVNDSSKGYQNKGRKPFARRQQASNLFETASSVQERRDRTGLISTLNIVPLPAGSVPSSAASSIDGGEDDDRFSNASLDNNNNNNINNNNNNNNNNKSKNNDNNTSDPAENKARMLRQQYRNRRNNKVHQVPHFLSGKARLDGGWGPLYPDGKATFFNPKKPFKRDPKGFASYQGGRTPPVFLQELAHLASLLTAVALSTLRNDIDGAESPLDFYHIGSEWPEVDPRKVPELYNSRYDKFIANLNYFLGVARTPEERTKYNASRPLSVLGGVSDSEIRFLQMARGPYAKTMLCWNWLSEFITREHLAGSLGDVGPPIISRIVQFLGDGMIYYNHARKIMFIPFPFPHAQLSAVYVLIMLPLIPFLMDQYCVDTWVGSTLTFLSVACLSGIHEVARELENPFRNVPNEIPICLLMAEFNEALVTMYSGYHPDLYWEAPSEQEVLLHQLERDAQQKQGGDDDDDDNDDDDDDDDYIHGNSSSQIFAPGKTSNRSGGGDDNFDDEKDRILFRLSERSGEDDGDDDDGDENKKDSDTPKKESIIPLKTVYEEGEGETKNDTTTTSTTTPEELSKTNNSTLLSTGTNGKTTTTTPTPIPAIGGELREKEVDQLRAIVQQQGMMMEQMLQEQARLNKLIQEVLLGNNSSPSSFLK